MAYIAETAQVSGSALVMDSAVVGGSAVVRDSALVRGSAVVRDSAVVGGSAVVRDSAKVMGSAVVRDWAKIMGSAKVMGSAVVSSNHVVRDQKLWRTIPTLNTSDGYTVAYWPNHDGVWMITAGCRYFTIEEARQHWMETRANTDLGRERLMILDWLGVWRENIGQAWYDEGPQA